MFTLRVEDKTCLQVGLNDKKKREQLFQARFAHLKLVPVFDSYYAQLDSKYPILISMEWIILNQSDSLV